MTKNECKRHLYDVAAAATRKASPMTDTPRGSAARRRRDDDERFCPRCEIDLGLHGTDDPEPDDCRYAASKADLLTSMDRLFGGRRGW